MFSCNMFGFFYRFVKRITASPKDTALPEKALSFKKHEATKPIIKDGKKIYFHSEKTDNKIQIFSHSPLRNYLAFDAFNISYHDYCVHKNWVPEEEKEMQEITKTKKIPLT